MSLPNEKVKVNCNTCGIIFFKELRRFRENSKLGNNFYCSKICQYNHQKTGSWFICENTTCKKKFYRIKNDILEHDYCSRSCAATVNNKKYPKKFTLKICANCSKQFRRESHYCSLECGKISRFRYSKEEIIKILQDFHIQFGRVPAKRESKDIYRSAEVQFGSWNKAVSEAGLIPNRSEDDRMYRRSRTVAADGHKCDSISEAIIDNWLSTHRIPHERNAAYPSTNHKADWSLADNTFAEYFGLAEDSPRYDREIKIKKELCRQNKIRLIEIYARDLYPENNLDNKLKFYINTSAK